MTSPIASSSTLESSRLIIIEPPSKSTSTGADDSGGFFYVPNFVSEQEEEYLLQQIYDAPALKWKTLQNRSGRTLGRLQTWGGQLAGSSGNTLIPQPLPSFFTSYPNLVQRLVDTGAFQDAKHGQPNHCLVNEYLAGQGIMPHEDGGAYFPAVATISLGSHTLLDIFRYAVEPSTQATGDELTATPEDQTEVYAQQTSTMSGTSELTQAPSARAREKDPAFSIFQERRSLLITLGSAYRKYLHGIAERSVDEPAHLKSVINLNRLADPELKARIQALIDGEPDSSAQTPGVNAPNTETSKNVDAHATADAESSSEEKVPPTTTVPAADDVANKVPEGLRRDTRVSLTFRDVEKVSAGLQKLLGRGGGKR
ncbi:hypothetical protein V8E36_004073 [Tilletia maclaganii]